MQSLPAELKHYIVRLSSGSPNNLAALARTHSAYQREAEKALYDTLSISASSDNSLKCMETLATNAKKAALVRFLIIEFTRNNITNNQRVTAYLLKSLINMHSLSDFRVRSRPGEAAAGMINSIGKILCQGHSRLQTLYCHDVLDISRIIKSQTELQILGLYTSGTSRGVSNILKALKELHNAQLFLPIIFTLSPLPILNIFPAFYPVDRRATIYQVLSQSICKDRGKHILARVDNVPVLSIYLIDSSDMPFIYALAKDMAVIFPQVGFLNLFFERRCGYCDIPQQEIKEKFSFFSKLREVNTDIWPTA